MLIQPEETLHLVWFAGRSTGSQSGGGLLSRQPLSQTGGSLVLLDGSGNIIASAVQYPRSDASAAPDATDLGYCQSGVKDMMY